MPWLAPYVGCLKDDRSIPLVMELCSGGNIQGRAFCVMIEPGQGLRVSTWQRREQCHEIPGLLPSAGGL